MAAAPVQKSVRLEINLLPAEYRSTKTDLSWLSDRRVVWPSVLLLMAAAAGFLLFSHISETIGDLESDLDRVKTEVEKERPLLAKIKQLDEKLGVIAQKNKALKSIQVSKKRWVILFENISAVLPPNMWLISLSQLSTNEMELRGVTRDFSEVAEYMVRLEQQVSITNVTLVTISTTKVQDEDTYNFTIKAVINQDLGLEGAR